MYSDSSATVDCVNSDMIHKESRWNSIRLNWLRQQVLDRLVRVVWLSGYDMLADICTKHQAPLQPSKIHGDPCITHESQMQVH